MILLFQEILENLYQSMLRNKSGEVADYIPELAKANADDFGIAIATVDGHVYQVGDSQTPFSIQSISKAFAYGIALEDENVQNVFAKVDVEPSGEAFNSISLEENTGRPRNPMINAGAIAITNLVSGSNSKKKVNRILDVFGKYAGHQLSVNQNIYLSEKSTGHRNRAIAHLLRNYEIINCDPEIALDAYFQQCSIMVTCRDLAMMGASLANNGVNPVLGVRVIPEKYVSKILSVMASCGMYDYSGNWIYSVGMPAKSGVGGGIVAVLPGQFGLAVYSPRLDEKGNSVRGIAVCEEISSKYGLHMMHSAKITNSTVIRAAYTASEVHSRRDRPAAESQYIADNGDKILIYELMGSLSFVSMELVLTELTEKLDSCCYLIIDFSRVNGIDEAASNLLISLLSHTEQEKKTLIFIGLEKVFRYSRYIKEQMQGISFDVLMHMEHLETAMEWCEETLLGQSESSALLHQKLTLKDHPFCQGMSDEEIEFINANATSQSFKPGDYICRNGDPANELFFICSGKVSAWISGENQKRSFLGGASTGSIVGESSLLGNLHRSADVICDSEALLITVNTADFINGNCELTQSIQHKVFRNLSFLYDKRIRKANSRILALSS